MKYGEAADEWPAGHTPTELKEKRRAELKEWEDARKRANSSESDCSDEDDDDIVSKVRPEKGPAAPVRPRPARYLPSPALSTDGTMGRPHERKRKRTIEEEREQPIMAHASSTTQVSNADGPVTNTPQGKESKRRRISTEDDEVEEKGERPDAAHISSAGITDGAVPEEPQGRGTKRRRVPDKDEEEERPTEADRTVPETPQRQETKRRRVSNEDDGEEVKKQPAETRFTSTTAGRQPTPACTLTEGALKAESAPEARIAY